MAALLNVAMVVILRGGFGHTVLAGIVALWLGIPAVLVGGAVYAVGHHSQRARRIGARIAVCGVVCISGIISIPPGNWLLGRDIAAAELYCEPLIVQIDAYYRTHGSYPPDLSAFHDDRHRPLLIGSLRYWSNGSTFGLDINDPRGMMNWIGYSSTDRQWRAWH